MTAVRRLPWYFAPVTVLVAGCIVAIINFGVRSTFGLFTLPISEFHDWPRETYSMSIALQNLLWGLMTPFAGMLADRFGSARVLIGGAVVYSLGIAVISIVMAALGRIVPPEKRSWAFGLATASGSLGQFIFAPLTGALIAAYGWNAALLILAASTLLIILFSLPLLVQNMRDSAPIAGETALAMRRAIMLAFTERSYLLLTLGFFVCGFQLTFITVHLPPYLAEHGISKEFAGLALGLIGLFNVAGSYAAGIIGGRGEKPVPLSLIYLFRSLAVMLFILLPITPPSTLLFTAIMGLLWLSTIPLTMGIVIVLFGTRYMATLYGFVFVSHQLGSFLGVWLGGRLYDQFGSYDIVWWMGVALGLLAALINLPIRERRAPAFAAA